MKKTPAPQKGKQNSAEVAACKRLASLHEQTEEAQVELDHVREALGTAENQLGNSRSKVLLEANEQLVLTTLTAQKYASDCKAELDVASRSLELDPLTRLPNRVVLLDRFAAASASAKRDDTRLALLFLDIDNFKDINDTLGHAIGDSVLQLVAQRIVSTVRETDTVSRHGGDEFLILLTGLVNAEDAKRKADKVIAALAMPTRLGEHVLRLRASIGISIYPDDGEEALLLVEHADAAMYRAKRNDLVKVVFHHQLGQDLQDATAVEILALQHPLTLYEAALAEHESRYVQLRDANQQLVLAALNAQELQAASEDAQRRQTEFLGVLAHELRTPLTPIRIAASMMDSTGKDALPRMQAIIEQQVVHMARLVGDLLDVSRVNTGKLSLEWESVNMVSIIDQAICACRPAMDTRLQRLGIDVPPGALWVDGDPVRLVQILINLLDNASKYTPQAGEIELSVQVEGASVVIRLTDSGIGITAEALPHVFDPFIQDAHAAVFNREGLGIGLTVVRELVVAHGGSVVASSDGTGKGSTFVVTLPLVVDPSAAL